MVGGLAIFPGRPTPDIVKGTGAVCCVKAEPLQSTATCKHDPEMALRALKYQSYEPVAKPPSTRISFSRGPWGCALTDTKGLPGPCGPWSALHQQLASLDHTQVSFSIHQRSGIPDYAMSAVKAKSADFASCPPNSLPHTRHPSHY